MVLEPSPNAFDQPDEESLHTRFARLDIGANQVPGYVLRRAQGCDRMFFSACDEYCVAINEDCIHRKTPFHHVSERFLLHRPSKDREAASQNPIATFDNGDHILGFLRKSLL
jgi:hypothetical protein